MQYAIELRTKCGCKKQLPSNDQPPKDVEVRVPLPAYKNRDGEQRYEGYREFQFAGKKRVIDGCPYPELTKTILVYEEV